MFVELDTRHGDGLTVTLEWDRDTGHTHIVVPARWKRTLKPTRDEALIHPLASPV